MGGSSFQPHAALAVTQKHDWFVSVYLCCPPQKSRQVSQAFKTDGNGPGFRILCKTVQQFQGRDPRFVADADPFGNTAALICQSGKQRHSHAAGLTDDGDPTAVIIRRKEAPVESSACMDKPQSIRSKNPYMLFLREQRDFPLQSCAGLIVFLEPRADDNDILNPFCRAGVQIRQNEIPLHSNPCMCRYTRQLFHRAIAFFSEDRLPVGIDAPKRSDAGTNALVKAAADPSGRLGGTDDHNRFREKEAFR